MNQKSNMIKDIFFDIGNVLIDLHPQDCIQYWADSADLTKGEIIKAFSNDLHNAYEIGKITNNDFFYSFKNALPQPCCLKKSDFWRGWNKLLGKEKHTVEILKLLSLDYNIWLLSNTNPKHINNNLKLSSTFFEFVKGAIYSFEVGVRKPDPTIFENALKLSGSGSSKTLIIDDLIENIQIAKKLGWKARHYENDNLLQDQLTFLGIDTLASN